MTNHDIYKAIADIELALYYRLNGNDNPEGISEENLKKAHKLADDLLMCWFDVTGETY